jgi:uncharacterized repeat protein (TIGR01451 family)
MSLNEIRDKLYKNEADPELGKLGSSEFDAREHLLEETKKLQDQAKDLWKKKEASLSITQNKAVRTGLFVFLGIIFVLVVLVGIYAISQSAFSEKRVAVGITGPTEAKSGRLLTYEISYDNNNRIDLKGASLKITYPEIFRPEDNPNFKSDGPVSGTYPLGEIAGKKTGKIVLNGRVYSPKGALMYLKVELIYTPSNISTELVSGTQLSVNVVSAPLSVEILAPQNVSSGDEVNYLLVYKNEGEEDMSGIKIKMDYPEGFTFSGSEPKVFEGNNIWYIGDIAKGQTGRIVATGKLEGEDNNIKNVTAYIGSTEGGNFISYNEEYATTKIVAAVFSVFQAVNGVSVLNAANAGDTLRFEINFKNTSDTGFRDVIVSEKLDSPVLDYTTLEREGGFFDESNKLLTFKASDHPILKNLDPGASGVIKFSVKVKEVIPVSSANDKNFVISTLAKIDSPDVATPVSMNKIVAGNKMDIKLNSKLIMDVKGFYNNATLPNSGPIPPKSGQETTYTIHWVVTNVSNDISEARVEAVLPTGVSVLEKTFPEDAKITYSERTNSMVWEIGNMPSGAGIISEKKEAFFQVKLKPSPDQIGRNAPILGKTIFTAKDLFTGENLRFEAGAKDTELREDNSIGDSGYKVSG